MKRKHVDHGNVAGRQSCWLYRLDSDCGVFLKWGVSQHPFQRYTAQFMQGKRITLVLDGPRDVMLSIERTLVEKLPGPMNAEPWCNGRKPVRPRPGKSRPQRRKKGRAPVYLGWMSGGEKS